MAVVLDSLTAELSRTVFVKPPDTVRGLTSMPRALVNFSILNGTVSAKPVNDQQELIIGVTLPSNLAYRFTELSWSIVQDVANNWRGSGYMELTNALRSLPIGSTQRHNILFNDNERIPQGGEMQVASTRDSTDLPRYIIQTNPRGSPASPVITFKHSNQSATVATAGTTNFFCSFMEYDIEQVELYPTHWPSNVYIR